MYKAGKLKRKTELIKTTTKTPVYTVELRGICQSILKPAR